MNRGLDNRIAAVEGRRGSAPRMTTEEIEAAVVQFEGRLDLHPNRVSITTTEFRGLVSHTKNPPMQRVWASAYPSDFDL